MLDETATALGIDGHHRAHVVMPPEPFQAGSFKVIPFYVPHDVPCMNFFVQSDSGERMVYLTDCAYVPATFPALDIVALEINHDKETLYDSEANFSRKKRTRLNHMGLTEALRFLRTQSTPRLREVYVLHLSNETANERRILSAVQGTVGVPVRICEE